MSTDSDIADLRAQIAAVSAVWRHTMNALLVTGTLDVTDVAGIKEGVLRTLDAIEARADTPAQVGADRTRRHVETMFSPLILDRGQDGA